MIAIGYTAHMADSINLLELRDIRKSFESKRAIDGINLSLKAGEIVGLLGENGAGKTTLMNILFGLYRPDSGSILINSVEHAFKSPKDALSAGIGMIHQHFMLVPNHSVIENMVAASQSSRFFFPQRQMRERIRAFQGEFKLDIDLDEFAYNLSAGQLQKVEILKALLNGAQALILDEPTSVLSSVEVDHLFSVLRSMAEQGKIIVIISHKLEEILALCHRVVVLRKGKVTGEAKTATADKSDLARMMIGREIDFHTDRVLYSPGNTVLEIRNLSVLGDRGEMAVSDVSLTVHQREIVGIAGVSGNGQRELAEAITGLRRASVGSVFVDGAEVTNEGVKSLSKRGMAHIPEERMRFGIVPNLLLFENAVLKDYDSTHFSDDLFLKKTAIHRYTEMIVKNFQVAATTIHTPIKNLSGGNIQKLILGREISGDPGILVASHPTYGLDVGATEYIRNQLILRRDTGGAILLISEDLEEILSLSDRIAVMFEGRLLATLNRTEANSTAIGLLMAGVIPPESTDRKKS